MNIANLNHWGESFLDLAGPMLWQSSLLITIVFTLDVLSARKIRPAIRHALWMVVLVKLLLPPALALPTGAAWWLWPVKAAPLVPAIKHPTVTFDTTPLPENFSLPPFPQAPPPILSTDARAMLVSGVVSVGLLGWLVFQWPKAGRKNRTTGVAPEFENLLDDAQRLAGLRRSLQLRLIDDAQSPAVYGLWRPVILLPRALAEKLSEKQLRAVLLHEAIHVRRGDVWVNSAQTLLQIFYWWHPLLWLANARIRRLREEAVDDAVMLALRDEAEAYAPTLLEVAKFAFRRPLASLGLVGILESRSALRQRIERLVNFRAPRQAGVTLLSLCGIFAFSAVALPMGQAPGPTVDLVPANPPPAQASASSSKPVILIEGRFFWMQTDNFQTLTAGLPYDKTHHDQIKADAAQLAEINQRINGLHAEPFAHPFIQTSSGTEADLNISDQTTSGIEFDCTPVITDGVVDLDFKVRTTAVPVSLHETDYLIVHEHAIVETNGGFIVYFSHPYNALSNLVLVVGVKTGMNAKHDSTLVQPVASASIEHSDAFINPFPHIQPAPSKVKDIDLTTRTFTVGLQALYAEVQEQTGQTNIIRGLKELLSEAGVDFSPPRALFINNGMGVIFIRATKKDVDTFETILIQLHCLPQVHIKARFVKVPSTADIIANMLPFDENGEVEAGVLTASKMNTLLHQLMSQKETQELAEPEATTLSARQVQMRATMIQPVVTNFTYQIDSTNQQYAVIPQIAQVETGPVFDIVPILLGDGYTINIKATASQIDFERYANTNKSLSPSITDTISQKIELPIARPIFHVSQASTQKNIYDGQTLVLFPQPKEKSDKPVPGSTLQAEKKNDKKALVVFVTITLIDPTANRIHSDEKMPFAQNGIPAQPQVMPDMNMDFPAKGTTGSVWP
jgi:beta-lactamase regulating signal transducer with metallopeptidase domain